MLTDPMALVTDSALGLFAWILCVKLWRVQRMWALAFLFTGIAAIIGGIFHGFGDRTPMLWKATVMSVGVASFFLLAGTSRRLAVLATVKLVVYNDLYHVIQMVALWMLYRAALTTSATARPTIQPT